jgi:putative transposase
LAGSGNRWTAKWFQPHWEAVKPAKIRQTEPNQGQKSIFWWMSAAPLAIHITGANEHDKWSVDDLVVHIVKKRPNTEQHFCADKGYDYEDIFQFVKVQRYAPHINHRRRRNEPKVEECPIPGEKSFPARRWVIERTLGWLAKRRSIKIRWCKKPENWMAFLKLACADLLLNLIFE